MSNAFAGFLANRREALLQVLLIAGSLAALTYTANQFVLRADLTANNRYTLAGASHDIAQTLNDPVTVTAYFSSNLPARFGRTKEEFRALLQEFRAAAGGNVEFQFVNPNEGDQTAREARQAGIRPVTVNVRQQNKMTQKRAYLGAVFQYRDKREVVPFVEPNSALEYTIASTMKKLTVDDKPVLGVLQGQGEPGLNAMTQLQNGLKGRYDIRTISGVDTAGVPPEVDVLLVSRPESELSTQTALALDQYVMRGGPAIFALNRAQANMRFGQARPQTTGLEPLLESYGLPIRTRLVRDRNASAVRVRQKRGGFTVMNRVRYPYIPQIANFADHPISSGLDQVVFRFVSPLDTTQVDSTAQLTVLARSSQQSGLASLPTSIRPQQEWTVSDFSGAPHPVAGLLEGTFSSAFAGSDTLSVERTKSPDTKLVVIGDGDFIVNGTGRRKQRLPEGNTNLVANSVDYLAGDTGLISLRTQRVTSRPLMQLEPTTKTVLKYLNVLLPILLVIGYGLVRYRRNRAQRRRWKDAGLST
ncbi:GldG family protein [Salinibacter ruber]|uniref:GldG family protein n=1 Tax=Salinibacter ruber TaxID=146919 RepID=UPI0020736439|nr:Gldg family protein [Salinibacter ruber]